MEIGDVIPPDDSGRDAFRRYRYQAHATFKECLKCAAEEGPTAVICEHIEDVCIESDDEVILRQIKTRDPEYGPWRLRDLWASSGALRSVVRSHRAVADVEDGRRILYEIQLEGVLARDDPIRKLRRRPPAADEAVARAVFQALKGDPTKLRLKEAREIVARLTVLTAPPRQSIVAENRQLLAAAAPDLRARDLGDAYDASIELIARAMEGTLAADRWPDVLFRDEAADDTVDLSEKRLDVTSLRGPLEPVISGAGPLLATLANEVEGLGDLVRKLRLAGAGDDLIDQAKNLRANSYLRELELRARDMTGAIDNQLEDVDNRLLATGAVSIEVHGAGETPGAAVFGDLIDRLASHPEMHDPRGLFHQDPMLLMGAVCQLSGECRQAWRADA